MKKSLEKLSPLMKLSLELIEHANEHIYESSDFGNILALIHIDHSVDLLLKQKVMDMGKSIFKKDGRVISIHKAIEILGEKMVPEKPFLEFIHVLRNQCQHLGVGPPKSACEYCFEYAEYFIRRFLSFEYNINYYEVLGKEEPEPIGSGPGLFITQDFIDLVSKAKNVFKISEYTLAVLFIFLALEIFLERADIDPRNKLSKKLGKYFSSHKNFIEKMYIVNKIRIISKKTMQSNTTKKEDVEYMFFIVEIIENIEMAKDEY